MICRLRGLVVGRTPPAAVIEANGLGYEIWLPSKDFDQLPAEGSEVTLHTVQQMRDDAVVMYGFIDESERKLFLELLKISGIGAKSALGLLSGLDIASLAHAVNQGDTKAISRAPGIGPKAASRIILEMRDSEALAAAPAEKPVHALAFKSLLALGFKPGPSRQALAAVPAGSYDAADLVKAALKELSPQGKTRR